MMQKYEGGPCGLRLMINRAEAYAVGSLTALGYEEPISDD
jgi:hypothetical protein